MTTAASTEAPSPNGASTNGRFQILALSGGGYRGLFTARILADLEQHTGRPIAQSFDLLAGTSIGGILAIALSLEVPAEQMVKLFEIYGEKIFRARRAWWGFVRSPYTQDGLRELLEASDLFGQRVLGECRHRVLVPAINYTIGRPVIFKTAHHESLSTDHRHRLVDIALATSAAPGFFPRHVFNNGQYVDGGLYANAPGMLAVHEAEHFLKCSIRDLRVVAIGTMSAKFTVDPRANRDGGIRDWGGGSPSAMPKRLFGVAISAQETLAHHQLQHRLPSGHYHHIDEDLTDERARAVALDKTDKAAREVLLGSAAECAKRSLGQPGLREALAYRAPAATFFHGIHAK